MSDIDEKKGLLRGTEIFSRLNEDELEVVAWNSDFLTIPGGSAIFTEKAEAHELYIVREGEVLISRHTDEIDNIDIAQYIPGECFGEMDMIGRMPRDANAIAMKDTVLLVFPRQGMSFTNVINRYPKISARILHKILSLLAERIRRSHQLINEKTPWIKDLRRQVLYDRLTGLYNRSYLKEELAREVASPGESRHIILIKPDNFKDFNDAKGHIAGDALLLRMAIFITSALGGDDMAIRYAGDEFAIITPEGLEWAVKTAKDIGTTLYDMETGDLGAEPGFRITISAGISRCSSGGTDPVTCAMKAREKMIAARQKGGNRIHVDRAPV